MRIPAWMIFLGGIALTGVSAGIGLVIVSGKNRHALVRTDYYRDGLRLDEHRAREAAFDSLGLALALRQESGAILVEAGGPFDKLRAASGAVDPAVRERLASLDLVLQLRRPDDPSADRDVPMTFASDRPLLWAADAPPLRHGRWDVRAVFSGSSGLRFENAFSFYAADP